MNRLFIMTIALCTAIIVLFSPTLADDGVFGPRFVVGDNFSLPCGLAVDETNDRVLVADTGNHCVKYAPITDLMAGPLWTTFGYVADRSAPEALNLPQGVAVDPAGNAYVVDTVSNEVQLYRYSAGSYVYDSDFARDTRTSVAGVDIDLPRDIAVGGPDNKIYLLDSGNNRVLEADGPEDTTWDVFRSGVGWGNPYGIDVDAAGNVYLADPTNSRIIKLLDGGGESPFGSYGTGAGQFRHPRDVAVSSVDGRMFVADTHNHRITRLLAGGAADDNLGMGPAFGTLQKTAADSAGRLYALDSQREHLVVYFGAGTAPGFDVYLRDYTADTGDAATPESAPLVSPDIIIRHTPDIDTAAATAAGGLSAYASQMPRYGQNNYVYLACRNRGEQEVTGVTARIYYGDPDSLMLFPADWEDSGFYMSYATSTENTPGNALFIPYIPPRTTGDGVYVAGPIIWRPPHPGGGIGGMGRFLLMAQLEHLHDLITPAPGLERVRENNNVAIIPVTVARGGIPVGEQDVLVVRVNFPDITDTVAESTIMTRLDAVETWLAETSYGLVSLDPLYRGPVSLDEVRSYYYVPERNVLIEMATEVLNKLLSSEPGVLDGPTSDPEDDIERVVLVVNDPLYDKDWATTGAWPYELADGAGTRYLSVSVHGPSDSTEEFTHGLCHQFGLEDLYLHDNVIGFPEELLPEGWDVMARVGDGMHPLTWSKELATWLTSSGGLVHYIPRPGVGEPPYNGTPVQLHLQSTLEREQVGAIAIGLTDEVSSFEHEDFFFWIEARSPDLGNFDDDTPDKGVIAYTVHKLIDQGQGPVLMRDTDLTTPAVEPVIPVGGSATDPLDMGIDVRVVSEVADNGGYMVEVDYDPPDIKYNVKMHIGDPHWTSPDIWIDNQRDGGGFSSYDHAGQRLLADPIDENPIEGEDNRIFARVHNEGPGVARNIRVQYRISAPYHTVGGSADFDYFGHVIISEIPADSHSDVFITWRPEIDDQHNCVVVDLMSLANDSDDSDNRAQQNFTIMESRRSSPYDPVSFTFHLTNPRGEPQLVYLCAEGVPADWHKELNPEKYLLQPKQRITGTLSLTPPEGATVCADHHIFVTSWIPSGDTLVYFGGSTVQVSLRNRTRLTGKAGATDGKQYLNEIPLVLDQKVDPGQVAAITIGGGTNPQRKNQQVYICYRDPAGNPHYRRVTTDEYGGYRDIHLVVEGGPWQVEVYYPGTQCAGSAEAVFEVDVPIPQTGDQDQDGLPDDKEPQGDADNDGIPNHLDQDADGDGLPDGQEQPGNADEDSLVNVIDPDSDNDGLLDGEDPEPYIPGSGSDGNGKPPGCPTGFVLIWCIIAAIVLVVSICLYFLAYRSKAFVYALIASVLLAIIAVIGLLYCYILLHQAAIALIITAVILLILFMLKV